MTTCEECPAGYTSEVGSTDESDCVAPPSTASSLSGGAIAGIVIAVIIVVATCGAAFFYFDRMNRDKKRFLAEIAANQAGSENPMQQSVTPVV